MTPSVAAAVKARSEDGCRSSRRSDSASSTQPAIPKAFLDGVADSGADRNPTTVHGGLGISSTTAVVLSILFYSSVSLGIVYFNWWLFTGSFRFPVFVSWVQQVFGLTLYIVLSFLGRRLSIFRPFSVARWPKRETLWNVLPLALSFIGMVGLANLCLKFVQVSTYQVARSLTIFFTMALSFLILRERQRPLTMMACGVMVIGFIVGSLDASTLSFIGVVAGGCSSVFQAAYNVAIKKTLQHVDNDPNLLLYYNLCISSVLFIPVIFIAGEIAVFDELIFVPNSPLFFAQWGSLFMSGLLATLVNLASYWCVKVTSPLTFNIVGFTKSILQTVGGILFLGDLVSGQSLAGIVLSLGGSGWYSYLKVKEAMSSQKPQQTSPAYGPLEYRRSSTDLDDQLKDELGLVESMKGMVDHDQRLTDETRIGSHGRETNDSDRDSTGDEHCVSRPSGPPSLFDTDSITSRHAPKGNVKSTSSGTSLVDVTHREGVYVGLVSTRRIHRSADPFSVFTATGVLPDFRWGSDIQLSEYQDIQTLSKLE